MWVTRLAVRAKVAIAKVKWEAAPMANMDEGKEAGPSVTQDSAPTLNEIRLLGV